MGIYLRRIGWMKFSNSRVSHSIPPEKEAVSSSANPKPV